MRQSALALAFLMLATLASASLESNIRSYMTEGETLDMRAITTESGEYTLAIINGRDSMMFLDPDSPPLTDPVPIYLALKSEYLAEHKVSVDTQALVLDVADFNASRYPQQTLCEQYTGVDRFPCTDFSTCRYACLSAPVCRDTFEGNGDMFIYAIQSWRTKNAEIDKAVVDFKEAAVGIPANAELASSANSYLLAMEARATEIQENRLFTVGPGYFFCPRINFSFAKLNEIKEGLAQIKAVLAELPNIEKNSNVISGISEQRIRQKNENDEVYQFQETYSQVKVNISATRDMVSRTLVLVKSPGLSKNLADLVALSDQMGKLGGEMNYSGALELKNPYFNLSKNTSLLSARLIQNYTRMNDSLAQVRAKLDADINITGIGDYYAKEYTSVRVEFESLSALAKPPAEENSIPKAEQNLTVLNSRLVSLELNGRTALEFLGKVELARTNFTRLSKSVGEYKQNYNLAEISGLIEASKASAKSAQFLQADISLGKAYEKTAEYERMLNEIIPVIETAKDEYKQADSYLNERKTASFLFLSADPATAESKCKQASNSIYSSPRDSVLFSGECKSAIDSEVQALEYKKYGLLVGVVIVLYIFYRWARKREWGFVVG